MSARNEKLPTEIPAKLNKWNWGAFLLTWIWGLGNSTFIALLMFVPFVNLVMWIMLGIKGSKWAWENNYWRDEAHFASTQRKWSIAGFAVFAAMILLAGGLFYSISGLMKSSDAYQTAMANLRSNPQVIEALGAPVKDGFLPSGSISVKNDSGKASFVISLTGSKKSGKATMKAIKQLGKWDIYLLFVVVEGNPVPIVLKNSKNIKIPGTGTQT